MKISLKGALSCYDVEAKPVTAWEYMWICLRLEYWEALFTSCGNVHPFRSAYARQVSLAKRQKQAADLLNSRMNVQSEGSPPSRLENKQERNGDSLH